MLGLLGAVLLFGAVVAIHEAGHYLMARCLGIEVAEFSLGFGRRMISWIDRRTGTPCSVRLLPMGGFVSFISEEDLVGGHAAASSAFEHQRPWKRLLVFLAGPGANLLTAALVCGLMTLGTEIARSFTAYAEETAAMRNTNDLLLYFDIVADSMLEMTSSPRQVLENIGGPLSALNAMRDFITVNGLGGMLELAVLISVNLALVNLLPLPGLDGGQAVMVLLEMLRGRRLNERWQICYGYAALGVMGVLLFIMFGNDLVMLFRLLLPVSGS